MILKMKALVLLILWSILKVVYLFLANRQRFPNTDHCNVFNATSAEQHIAASNAELHSAFNPTHAIYSTTLVGKSCLQHFLIRMNEYELLFTVSCNEPMLLWTLEIRKSIYWLWTKQTCCERMCSIVDLFCAKNWKFWIVLSFFYMEGHVSFELFSESDKVLPGSAEVASFLKKGPKIGYFCLVISPCGHDL